MRAKWFYLLLYAIEPKTLLLLPIGYFISFRQNLPSKKMYPWPSDDLNLKMTLTSIWHWPSDDHDKFTQKSLHCQKVDVWKSHSANTLVYSECCVFCTASVLHVHTISCHEYIESTPLQICHDLVLPCLPSPS